MLKRTQYFSVPSEVPISPAWMPTTCELPVKVKREAFEILHPTGLVRLWHCCP